MVPPNKTISYFTLLKHNFFLFLTKYYGIHIIKIHAHTHKPPPPLYSASPWTNQQSNKVGFWMVILRNEHLVFKLPVGRPTGGMTQHISYRVIITQGHPLLRDIPYAKTPPPPTHPQTCNLQEVCTQP